MERKEYLLDSNVIISIWEEYPSLFQEMEESEGIDFKVYYDIVAEVHVKEAREFKGQIVLTERFVKLLDHIIKEDEVELLEINKPNITIKYDAKKHIYYINGNKLSENDYKLICICERYKQYILVTEDKKLLNSGKDILDSSRVLNLKEFLWDLGESILE